MTFNYPSIAIIILSLLSGGQSLFAQHQQKRKPNASINIYTPVNDSLKQSVFNIGFLTNIYQLKGVGINVISSVIKQNAYGVQLSGLANLNGKDMDGLQLSGITNVNSSNISGIMTSGLVNLTGRNANGLSLTGGINITGKGMNGLAFAGLMNISGENNKGFICSGLANIAGSNNTGVALSGLMNVNAGDLKGTQISSLLNITGNESKGAQIAALGNVSVETIGIQASALSNITASSLTGLQVCAAANIAMKMDKAVQISPLANICLQQMKGAQIGLLNICAGDVKGVQIGIVNHSKDTSTVKIGLVNVNPKTRIQLLAYGGNTTKLNLAVRFKNKMTYTMLGAGTHYLGLNDKFSGALFYRAGLYWPLLKQLEISGDLGYYHIENFKNKSDNIPQRMYSLQARVNLEYHPLKKFGIFASGGYGITRHYNKNKMFENKPVIEFGIVLF